PGRAGARQQNRVVVTVNERADDGIAAKQPGAGAQLQPVACAAKIKIGLIGPPRTCAGDEHLIAKTAHARRPGNQRGAVAHDESVAAAAKNAAGDGKRIAVGPERAGAGNKGGIIATADSEAEV